MKEVIGDLVYERDALPCPFCGSKDILRMQMRFGDSTKEDMLHEDGTMKWSYLKCSRCEIETEAYYYEQSSLDRWNRRVEPRMGKRAEGT